MVEESTYNFENNFKHDKGVQDCPCTQACVVGEGIGGGGDGDGEGYRG